MTTSVFGLVTEMFVFIFAFFVNVYEKLGAVSLFFGAFTVFTVCRFLVVPLFGGGSGSSDTAKKSKSKESENNG